MDRFGSHFSVFQMGGEIEQKQDETKEELVSETGQDTQGDAMGLT